ncbi:hypothetical protein [Treponema sp.]|uniref:hypothetical protein n=1 Tax=Treponema sp. TaxID=166 RepID=UPI003F04100A
MKHLFIIFFLLAPLGIFSQTIDSTQSHEGKVNFLFSPDSSFSAQESFYSAGNDGFIIKWTSDGMGEHYQVSELQVRLVAKNPVSGDIAVYETDGISNHRLTVLDEKTYTKKFSKKFANSIVSISFSSRGKYLFAGTTAVNGTFILNATTGTVIKKATDVSGIVPLILTGDSEKTAIMYSKSGTIYYYDLLKMKVKAQFSAPASLNQTVLFGTGNVKNRFIAGEKNNSIYVLDATSGKTLATYQAGSPILFVYKNSNEEKQGLYYIADSGKNFSLNLIRQQDLKIQLSEKTPARPLIIKNFTGLKNRDTFTCAAKNSGTVLIGTQAGNIYSMTDIPESELYTISSVTENMYQKVYDIDSDGQFFYILTRNSLYKTSYDTKVMTRITSSFSQTNISKHADGLVLWTKNASRQVQLVSVDGSENSRQLFTPSAQIRNLRVFKDKIIYILGTSIVGMYDIATGENSTLYTGTSVQDAVMLSSSHVIVAKTATGKGDSAMVSVNIETKETVPLKFTGDVAFSLSCDNSNSNENQTIYGISINSENGSSKTEVFSYSPKSGIKTSLFTLQAEDTTAFAEISYPFIFTNIGKNQIRAYSILAKKTTTFHRSASMPMKSAGTKSRLAVLNYNGSISWYEPNSQNLLADWYLTTDGDWIEF